MAKKQETERKLVLTTNIRQFGGSLGVILPKACAEFGFLDKKEVVVVVKNREIKIVPAEDVDVVKKATLKK